MFNQYPYININDLNLDYILRAIKEMRYEVTNFVSINAIKYADPIQWSITSQYEKNTIVIDPVTGTAYISVAAVPAGVSLTRPEYWTVVFDLGSFVTRAAQNFTSRWESETTLTATFSTPAGGWLVWGDVLYKALVNITAGDTYVENGNIEHFTIEDLYTDYLNTIANIMLIVGDLADLNTADKTSIVNAINSVNTALSLLTAVVGALDDLTTADKTSVVNAINEIVGNVGDLANLTTTDKDSVVDAINELVSTGGGSLALIGDLNDLNTTDKSNLVAAINEVLNDITSLDLSIYQQYVSNPYFENIGVIHTDRATDEIIGQDICKIGNTLLFANRGTVVGLNSDAHLYSIDLTTGSYTSVVLPIGHGNGITYNPDNGLLYITPLDNTTVGGKYVIHRVNYPALTMASDVYTDEYYAAIAYDPVSKNFVGMRRGVRGVFDLLDVDMNVIKTFNLATTGVQQTIDYYDGKVYILESAPNKLTIANVDEEKIVWTYMAVDNFDQYPLSEFNGLSYDPSTGELYIGNNLNYQNGFLVSSYEFFKVNLYNNNVTKRTLTNHGINLLDSIYVTSRKSLNNIFQYGTSDAPVDLLEYALAMATTTKGVGITFVADYTDTHPINIIGHTELISITNTGHSVTLGGLDIVSNNTVTLRGINVVGDSRILSSCSVLCNDSQLTMQNCTITKVNATREMTVNRSIVIVPTSPFSGYTINKTISLVELA